MGIGQATCGIFGKPPGRSTYIYIYIYSINGIQIQPLSLIVEGSLMISDPNPQNRGTKARVEILRSAF